MFDTFMPKLLNVNLFHYVYILLLLCGYEGTRPQPLQKTMVMQPDHGKLTVALLGNCRRCWNTGSRHKLGNWMLQAPH